MLQSLKFLKVETLQVDLRVGTSPLKNLIPPSGISRVMQMWLLTHYSETCLLVP